MNAARSSPPEPADGRRERLAARLRPWLERLGIAWLSRPALNGLDRALEGLLPQRGGFFVEAGANDGFRQSNTYHLARFCGWRGVLVEPFPHLAARCAETRPESITVCCALGAPEAAGSMARLRHAGLMSHVSGALGDEASELRRARDGQRTQGMELHDCVIEAPVRTLTEVLAAAGAPARFDLLSLDVEGYEVEVLRGLDLERHMPRAVCIEVRDGNVDAVAAILGARYRMERVLHRATEHADYFWRAV